MHDDIGLGMFIVTASLRVFLPFIYDVTVDRLLLSYRPIKFICFVWMGMLNLLFRDEVKSKYLEKFRAAKVQRKRQIDSDSGKTVVT
jgi:hypothetical protein